MLSNKITYCVEGTQDFVTNLKLKLEIKYKDSFADSLKLLLRFHLPYMKEQQAKN